MKYEKVKSYVHVLTSDWIYTYSRHTTQVTYRSNNVGSQQPVGHLISKDFHKSVSIIVGLCPAVCSEREFANLIFNTLESKK